MITLARYAGLLSLCMIAACGARDAPSAADDAAASEAVDEAAARAVLTAEEEAAGWILLFDGVSTDGWRGYGRGDFPTGDWKVEGGELVGQLSSGNMEGADIITVAEFTDFEVVFDFKVSPEGNSGVFYRVQEKDGKGLWQVAAEYQVLDDTAYIEMGTMDMHTHLTGDNYDLQSAVVRPTNPVGEWNTGRIVVEGNHVEHWLNGQMTVEYELYTDEWEAQVAASKFSEEEHYARAPSGSIGLQDHGTPIWYRDFKIRPIGGGS